MDLLAVLEEARTLAINYISRYSESIVFHDIRFANRLQEHLDILHKNAGVTEQELTETKILAWIISASFEDHKMHINKKGVFTTNIEPENLKKAEELFSRTEVDDDLQERIKTAIKEVWLPNEPITRMGQIFADALSMDFVMGDSRKHLKKYYKELLLKDVNISKKKWIDMAITLMSNFKFYLPYCQENLQPLLNDSIKALKKEKKDISRTSDIALQRELDISDEELRQLKKNLVNSKGRDDRGIQTVFRTTTKNHYTLNEMVDRKANIMITVNSVILSLVLGGVIGEVGVHGHFHVNMANFPLMILTLAAVGSIIFSILSVLPDRSHGKFTEDDIRNKSGNLLFYGNFHDMRLRDYEWGFLQMMNDQDYLYGTMIRDIYFLGKVLSRKYKFLRFSLGIFLIGIVSAFSIFVLLSLVD